MQPRFWCKYICPTGAVFSVANLFRVNERKVDLACVGCKRCVEICPFDAINDDYTTRTADCTFCQTCGGVCAVRALRFAPRSMPAPRGVGGDTLSTCPSPERRGFLAAMAGTLAGAAVTGFTKATGADLSDASRPLPVRPPGSVPERQFLQLCIRCGECYQACPNDVLQPLGFQQGFEGLWTPAVTARWSGCEPSCANCGQVCPTGAIRALPIQQKRVARMGLAVVNQQTCLPYAGREECQLCVDECITAGYRAMEFVQVRVDVDQHGTPIDGTGYRAPVVLAEKCVGCGLCETRCQAINVKTKRLLDDTAIEVQAGPGKEDRLMSGSYVALRKAEQKRREAERQRLLEESGGDGGYLPDFLK
jgi:MauM/NapG family ferredoxin protein